VTCSLRLYLRPSYSRDDKRCSSADKMLNISAKEPMHKNSYAEVQRIASAASHKPHDTWDIVADTRIEGKCFISHSTVNDR